MGTLIIMSSVYKPSPGGMEEWTYQVACALCRCGRDVIVIAPPVGPEGHTFDQQQSFETIRLLPKRDGSLFNGMYYARDYSLFIPAFRRLLNGRNVEYVLVTDMGLYAGLKGSWVWLAASSKRIKKGIVFHGLDLEALRHNSWPARKLISLFVRNLDDVFCNSRFTAGLCGSLWGDSVKPIVAGCGICRESLPGRRSRAAARNEIGINTRHVLLTVARLVPRKGIDMVIRCLPKIVACFPDLIYVVGGTGPDLQHLERLASDMDCVQYVRFDGALAPEQLGSYYSAADIFVMPNRYIPGQSVEGFGIVFLEAAFYGLPAVGGNNGGVPEAVVDGQTGLLVDPGNEHEISEAIIRLLRNPPLRSNLGQAGQRRVLTEYTWDAVARRLSAAMFTPATAGSFSNDLSAR